MIDPVTHVPASYRLARFFLRGRAWNWYLSRLVDSEHRWNRPSYAEEDREEAERRKKERRAKIEESTARRIAANRSKARNGRMTVEGKAAAVKSVRAAIANAREKASLCKICAGPAEGGYCDGCRFAEVLQPHMQDYLAGIKSVERDGVRVTYADSPRAPFVTVDGPPDSKEFIERMTLLVNMPPAIMGPPAQHASQSPDHQAWLGPNCTCTSCMNSHAERLQIPLIWMGSI